MARNVETIPVVESCSLETAAAAVAIDHACRTSGFFAIHIDAATSAHRGRVIDAARRLFRLPEAAKERVSLRVGGAAWRGWFPLGGELTGGVPDLKEGFYIGRELDATHAHFARPLHGANVWPAEVPSLRTEVLAWMERMEALGQRALAAMATGLGLAPRHFVDHLTADPTVLFRIFRYPPNPNDDRWGVAEHSDYGLLTLLAHDGTPGLQVRVGDDWTDVDPNPDLIVCNIGDMLDRMTGGRYCSTPHRVRNTAATERISLPFFLDPTWTAHVTPLPLGDTAPLRGASLPRGGRAARWDHTDLATVTGTYGEWLVDRVRPVFPDLATAVLADAAAQPSTAQPSTAQPGTGQPVRASQ